MNEKKFEEQRARERVEDLKIALADSLNMIEGALEMFKFECEFNRWNDDVCMQIDDGCRQLGFALATICNWYKDDKKEEEQ